MMPDYTLARVALQGAHPPVKPEHLDEVEVAKNHIALN